VGGLYLYTVVQDLAEPRWTLAGGWDTAIPFVPEAVFVYLLFFPFFMLATFTATLDDWRRGVVASLIAVVWGFACFLVLPASMPRPDPSSVGALAGQLLRWLHDIDDSHNTFPSLHVTFTWIACMGFRHLRSSPLLIVVAAAISASTLFLKQHTLLDLAGGMLVAGVSIAVAWRSRWLAS
jgi:membrane-associated phospholipid phosphatase